MGKTLCIHSFCAAHLVDAKPKRFWLKAGDECVANPRRKYPCFRWKPNTINVTRDLANRGKRIMPADFGLSRFYEVFEGKRVCLGDLINL